MKLVLTLLVAAVLTAACSSGGGATGSESEASSSSGGGGGGAASVTADDFSFAPETAEVKVGDEVTWTVAEGSSAHTVKFDDEESKELAAGDTYSRTFDKAGEQKYVCGIHPQMTGTVTVK